MSPRALVTLVLLAELLFSSVLVVDYLRKAEAEAQHPARSKTAANEVDLSVDAEAFLPTWLKVAAMTAAALCFPAPWLLWRAYRTVTDRGGKALILGATAWYALLLPVLITIAGSIIWWGIWELRMALG